jgi:puromycin-sensitive aminopeptidase
VTVLAESASAEDATARFDLFWDRHLKAATPQEEIRYLFALARFHDDESFERLLDSSLGAVRTQNAPLLLRIALQNRTHGARAWDFMAEHWSTINEKYPSNGIPRMLEGIVALSQPDVANRVQAFFREHEVPQGTQTIAQHLERQRVHVALREREAPNLAAALA